jgi:hypothetical protein
MMDCFQCAESSMSKEYNSEKYFKFLGLWRNYLFMKILKICPGGDLLLSLKL